MNISEITRHGEGGSLREMTLHKNRYLAGRCLVQLVLIGRWMRISENPTKNYKAFS
jgi:hypothetical protein